MSNRFKVCWLCKHFYYSTATSDWSEYTPGNDFEMFCEQRHWRFDSFETSQEDFGKMLSTAENCKDYVDTKEN